MMVVRVGVVDLLSLRPDSMTKRVFVEAVRGATERLGWAVPESPFGGDAPTARSTEPALGQRNSPDMRAGIARHLELAGIGTCEIVGGRSAEAVRATTESVRVSSDSLDSHPGFEHFDTDPNGGPGPRDGIRIDDGCGVALAKLGGLDDVGAQIELTCFGIDPLGSPDAVDWPALAAMDALIISGSEPTTTDIADEPCLAIIERLLRECSGTASLLFSCQSAHAALYLLHGLRRQRLAERCHGVFDHRVQLAPGALGLGEMNSAAADFANRPEAVLTAGLTTPVRAPHSRWNVMTSADMRSAGLTVLLDSEEAEWQLAIGPEGLRHVFIQGHPEYLPDTVAREYRRDLRRWIADQTLPFPLIPVGYFPADVHERLTAHAESVRIHRDPALLDELALPADHTEVARDWSTHSQTFFANWLEAVRDRRIPKRGSALSSSEPAY